MINFFRKTRKQLADDNKPLKYARYAIGEIVLVVVGILIALQIIIGMKLSRRAMLNWIWWMKLGYHLSGI